MLSHTEPVAIAGNVAVSGHATAAIMRWRLTGDGLSIITTNVKFDPSTQEKAEDLAEVVIRSGRSKSAVVASPTQCLLIAHPIASHSDQCLLMAFPCELSQFTQEWFDECAKTIAQMAVSLGTPSAPSTEPVSIPTVPEADSEPSDSSDESLPSWKELSLTSLKKVRRQWQFCRTNARTYLKTIAVVVGLGLLPWPHNVSCKAVCEPAVRRYVVTPFDARLLESHVVIGQQVEQGELLATLDGSELRSQIAGIEAKLSQAQQHELAALSTGNHSNAALERLEVTALKHEYSILKHRQSQLEIRSPISGVVVTGDLERAQGAPLVLGDSLYEIASLDKIIVEVAVPEESIRFVEKDLPVSISLNSVPGGRFSTQIDHVHLRNEIRENNSVFIAEAEIANTSSALRPGMNAQANIRAGYRPLGWLLFRRPFNAVRNWTGW